MEYLAADTSNNLSTEQHQKAATQDQQRKVKIKEYAIAPTVCKNPTLKWAKPCCWNKKSVTSLALATITDPFALLPSREPW